MTIIPRCFECRRLLSPGGGGMRCEAFPDGIPMTILLNEHDHRESYAGDGGLRFEPKA